MFCVDAKQSTGGVVGGSPDEGPLESETGFEPNKEGKETKRRVRAQESAEAIHALGAEHFVFGTDLGQSGNPTHADGLPMYVAELMSHGVTQDQIKKIGRKTPASC